MTGSPTVLKAGSPEAGSRVETFHGFAESPPHHDQEPELTNAERELETLRIRLKAAEQAKVEIDAKWQEQFDLKLAAARAEISQQRSNYELKLIEELQHALQRAQDGFVASLATVREEAVAIACFGLEKLAVARDKDSMFLVSCIERRISEISDALIVSISVSPRDESLHGYLADSSVGKGQIESRVRLDDALAPGTARIDLLVGDIPINPGQGLATIALAAKGEWSGLHG